MASIRSAGVPGLIFSPGLTSRQVSSLDMTFEPSLGIMARKVDHLGMDIRSFREPLKRAIRDVVIPSIAMNFAKHGRPKWEPLAESTEAQRMYMGYNGWRILDRSGLLKKTMRQQNIWHIDTEKALLANLPDNVWYGVVHQAGMAGTTTAFSVRNIGTGAAGQASQLAGFETSGEIPARPFVVLQEEDEQAIDEIFLDWLDERALRAGLPTSARSKILSGDI